jgi:PAS domain S-box-containing protein
MSSTGSLSELDLLRSQVADLSRQLAERDRSALDLREQSNRLSAIVEGTGAETGEEFFAVLVTHLTSVLRVQYAVIGEVQGDRIKKIRTLAVSAGGALVDNFEYELAHTPCATALTQAFACFDQDLQAMFPQFQRLADLGAESYCAVSLRGKGGAVMGLLVIMDTKPLEHSDDLRALLGVFAPRIAVELERKRAEQERAEALANLHDVIETIPDIVFALDTQGNLVKWNRRLMDVTGYSHEELLNKPALAFVPPEEQTRTAAAIQRAFTEGYAELEGYLFTKNRCAIPYHWTGALLKNSHGEPIGITGIGRDVADRKQAEEALRVSEERFRAIFENAAIGIAVGSHTAGTGIDQVNPAFQSMTGYNVEELTHLGMKGLTYPDDLPASKAFVERLISESLTHDSIEKRYVKKDGSIMWAQTTVSSIQDEQGNYKNSVAMIQDITERKITEQLLAKEKDLLEMIATDTPLEEVLIVMCRTVEQVSEGALCSILLLDPDGLHLRHGAAPSLPSAYVRAIDGVAIGPTVGSCGTAAFTQRQVIVSNIADDPLWRNYRDLALCHDLRACWSTPITSSHGSVLGTFAVYHHEPQQPTQADLLLIERMTDVACIAIERRQAEEAVREAELRYRTIFEQAGAGVAQIDSRTGQFVQVNRQYCEIVGLTETEMLTITVEAISHPDDLERNRENRVHLLSGEIASFTMEKRYVRKDGSIVWVYLNVAPLWRPGETPTSHIAIVQDISERKWAEEALRHSERQLRTVLDALPVGVWFTDSTGKVLLANPAARQIWSGIKQVGIEQSTGGAGWWETIGPSSGLHRWALSHALTTGVTSLNETLDLECFDGTRKTIRNSTVPVQGEDGGILGAIVLNEDLSPLRQAQEALALTQFSVDHAVEGFFWIDPDARILSVNDAACRMLEYTRDELTTMTVHDIDPNLPPDLWPIHWEDVKQKGSVSFESKYWSRTGLVMDTEITFNYLLHDGHEYNCAIVRDITERKRGEDLLRASEQAIRALHEATAIPGLSLDERLQAVLEVGCRRFKLPIGVLTQVVGEKLEFTHVYAPGTSVTAGMTVTLSTTYCQTTLQSTGPVCVEHAGNSDWRTHPGYKTLGLECYIGTKLSGLTHMNGTVCFLGEDPYSAPFSQADKNFLQLMARWITGELDRSESERALVQSEERYRELYDDTPTMYFTLAMDGTVRSVNRYGAEQLGYLVEELIGHSVLGVFHELDKEAVAAGLSACLAAPEITKRWEFRKVRKDGRVIWVRETVRVGQSVSGEPVLLVTCEDITEKKLAEEQQTRQYDQLQAIFRMTLALSRATSLDDIYQQAIDCVQRALKADRAAILLFDEAGVVRFRASHGLSEQYQEAVEGHSPWTRKTVDPQPILIDDITSDPSVAQYRDIFLAEGINAIGFLPLILPEGLLGKFMLYYDEPHQFTAEEVGVAQTIASHVAYMIQRTRVDHALRVSEERYRSLVDNAPIGICVNKEGRFAYVNREMQRMLNATSAEQLIGMRVFDRIAPEFHAVANVRIHELRKGKSIQLLDEQYLRLDGSRVDVAVTAIPASFGEDSVVQVLVLDITERKRAEEALREKHALLSAIMDATTDIIFVKDLKGRYLHINHAGARAAGIPVEEVIGNDDDALWPADLAAYCKGVDQKVLALGTALTVEESTTTEGTRTTYLTTKAPYRDAMGRLIGIIGVARDISQIKRSEEELRRSHDFLRQVIDSDPNFIFAKDRTRRFTLANKAVADAYGSTVDQLLGKTDADFNANPDEVKSFWQKDLEVMDSLQERFIAEEVFTDSRGKMRWLQTVKRPILNEEGQAIMVLGASTDITDRKRVEEILRQRERDLHVAIEERERISQDLHDGILQSLFAVGLGLEASKSMMSPKSRNMAGAPLDQAIVQLNRVMHEIRNFIAGLGSDLLQGKDLSTALQHMLQSLTQNQAMRVRLAVEDRAAQAISVEQSLHLFLVIQEAVSNCIRHGRAKEATVSLKMLKQGVRLSIRDNGRGFNPETAKGAGHGLVNMAARARKIGARVSVTSKVNEGTRIVLDLPKEASYVPH